MWNKYTLDDIVEIEVTDQMMQQALAEQKFYNENKQSSLTVPMCVDRDIKGSLCHQALELYFGSTPYRNSIESTRQYQQKGGDKYDIKFGSKIIDVKHAYGKFNPTYFFNHNCGVSVKEWNDRLADSEINYFVFVNYDRELNKCFILGAIDKFDFFELKQDFNKGFDGYQIKSRQLIPIRKFIYG